MNNDKRWLRDAIGKCMNDLAVREKSIIAVSADLFLSSRLEKFMEMYPDRIYNTGIAEQNMIGFAAGLAHEGFNPFVFSMASFLSMRSCEQCRTDVAYGNLNIRLVGLYSGVSGGLSGATHWGMEDCAIMCAFPNMVVLEPSDAVQAEKMLKATLNRKGPIYIRVSVAPVADLYDKEYRYEIGRASVLREGSDGAYICSGVTVQYAVQAAVDILKETGMKIRVIDMHTIKPIDRNAVRKAAETKNIVVAQDHSIIGGLGYMVANIIAEENLNTRFEIAGINDVFVPMARADYLYHLFQYDADGLKKRMLRMMKGGKE